MSNTLGKTVIIVGGGIVGASLAYHLADKCAALTLLEAKDIASGVTGTSFAWLSRSHDKADPIAELRGAAIKEYHRLETELPALKVQWCGSLSYGESLNEAPRDCRNRPLASLISRPSILELEPNLKHPPQGALYDPEEGAVDAVAATCALIAGAQARGAKILTHTKVVGFAIDGAKVNGIYTANGIINADVVVLAAGTSTTALAKSLKISLPINKSPAIFLRYKGQHGLVRTIISNDKIEIRQDSKGALLVAEDFQGESIRNLIETVGAHTAQAIKTEFNIIDPINLDLAKIGKRPIPADGIPIIGYLPDTGGVYICVMHPGVTLAAVVGRLASEEIAYNIMSSAFCKCRPERFLKA